jgi:acyl-CoA thioesterase II
MPRMGGNMASNPQPNPTPEELVADLMLLLDLEQRGGDVFIGRRHPEGTGRVFGGQAIAQALGAARRTVPAERYTHSLHAYFLRPGSDEHPIEFRVKRDLDGRSVSNRRVVASQRGEPILNLTASFQLPHEGLHHQAARMPDVPPPEELRPDAEFHRELAESLPDSPVKRLLLRPRPLDLRSIEPIDLFNPQKREPRAHCWIKTVAMLPDYRPIHRAVLAYASDFQLLSSAMHPHGVSSFTGQVKAASIDHAIWFHQDFRADEWLLYAAESPWSGMSRGFGRGQIFTRDGRLVASVAQEGMMRLAGD